MFKAVYFEQKKSFKSVGLKIIWLLSLLIFYIAIRNDTPENMYSDLFLKLYDMAPFLGLMIFTLISPIYSIETISSEVVRTTMNGRHIPAAKQIMVTILCSLMSLSILAVGLVKIIAHTGLSILLQDVKDLWYFEGLQNFTVLQMILLQIAGMILGSMMLSAIGCFLSAKTKSTAVTFISGALILGIPYILNAWVGNISYYTPLYAFFIPKLIGNNVGVEVYITQVILVIGSLGVLVPLTKTEFLKKDQIIT